MMTFDVMRCAAKSCGAGGALAARKKGEEHDVDQSVLGAPAAATRTALGSARGRRGAAVWLAIRGSASDNPGMIPGRPRKLPRSAVAEGLDVDYGDKRVRRSRSVLVLAE